jgi:hypothetical protein
MSLVKSSTPAINAGIRTGAKPQRRDLSQQEYIRRATDVCEKAEKIIEQFEDKTEERKGQLVIKGRINKAKKELERIRKVIDRCSAEGSRSPFLTKHVLDGTMPRPIALLNESFTKVFNTYGKLSEMPLSEDLACLIGIFAAIRKPGSKSESLIIQTKSPKKAKELAKMIGRLFPRPDGKLPSVLSRDGGNFGIKISSPVIVRSFLDETRDASIVPFYFLPNAKCQMAFLKGFFTFCGGSAVATENSYRLDVLRRDNPDVLRGVQYLLSRFGCHARISEESVGTKLGISDRHELKQLAKLGLLDSRPDFKAAVEAAVDGRTEDPSASFSVADYLLWRRNPLVVADGHGSEFWKKVRPTFIEQRLDQSREATGEAMLLLTQQNFVERQLKHLTGRAHGHSCMSVVKLLHTFFGSSDMTAVALSFFPCNSEKVTAEGIDAALKSESAAALMARTLRSKFCF